jgi:acyl carrier protein
MPIREELRNFVIENFLYGQSGGLADGDSFLEKGIIDSTGVLELVAFLESRFGIKLQDGEIIPENLDSIDNLTQFLTRRGQTGAGAV